MKVEILGWGCPRCRQLEKLAREVVAELAIPVDVERVMDIDRIPTLASFGIFSLPGLLIDGKLVATGNLPSKERLARWILDAIEVRG